MRIIYILCTLNYSTCIKIRQVFGRFVVELQHRELGVVAGGNSLVPEVAVDLVDTKAVQGNLDPTLLLGPVHRMLDSAELVLQQAGGRPGRRANIHQHADLGRRRRLCSSYKSNICQRVAINVEYSYPRKEA